MTNDELEAVSQGADKALDNAIEQGLKWMARATRAEAHAERLAGALEAMVAERHFHQAQPTGDGCEFCGKDLRDTIHYSCGETGSTDRARAMLALSDYNQRTET